MNKKISILMAVFVLAFSTLGLANREKMRALAKPPTPPVLEKKRRKAEQEEAKKAYAEAFKAYEQAIAAYPTKAKTTYKTGLEPDGSGATFLHWLCFEGSPELVGHYLDTKKDAIHTVDSAGDGLLHYAIAGDNFEVVELLIERHANTIAQNILGDTPLIRAVKTLLDALHKRKSERPQYTLRIVQALLKARAHADGTNHAGETALHFAVQLETDNVAKALMKAGASRDLMAHNGMTPLRHAAAAGRVPLVQLLLNYGHAAHADPSQVCDDGFTALHDAARNGHLEVVHLLVMAGADLEALTDARVSPLMMAARNGHAQVAVLLVKYGAKMTTFKGNLKRVDREGSEEAYSAESEPTSRPPKKAGGFESYAVHHLRKLPRAATFPLIETPAPTVEHPVELWDLDEWPAAMEFEDINLAGLIDFPSCSVGSVDAERNYFLAIETYLEQNVRGRTHIRHLDGTRVDVTVVPTKYDGNCGFYVLDLERRTFIERAAALWNRLQEPNLELSAERRQWFFDRMSRSMRNLGVNTIDAWAVAYNRRQDNGDYANWLDETTIELISYLFNYRVHIYYVDPEHADAFMPPPHGGVIYEGEGPNPTDFHVTLVTVEEGQALTHYERLRLVNPQQPAAAPTVLGHVIPSRESMLQEILSLLGPAGVAVLHAKLKTRNGI